LCCMRLGSKVLDVWIRSIIRTEKRTMKITNSVRTTGWVEQYHIPRSQVWEGSRGGQKGNVHLHVAGHERISLASQRPPRTMIQRDAGATLCGKLRGWMERDPKPGEQRCPRCDALANRYGLTWPSEASMGHA
jgi:hypothetical protein